jgi:hypothetical protein
VPFGIWLVVLLVPEAIMAECRAKANQAGLRPVNKTGMIVVIALWLLAALALGWVGYSHWAG